MAAENGDQEIVNLLLERGANTEAKDQVFLFFVLILLSFPLRKITLLSFSPVKLGIYKSSLFFSEKALKSMSRMRSEVISTFPDVSKEGDSPVILASRNNHKHIIPILLDHGANLEDKDKVSILMMSRMSWTSLDGKYCPSLGDVAWSD